MSLCVFLSNEKGELFLASDTATSFLDEGKLKRGTKEVEKIFNIKNRIYFISGELEEVYDLLNYICENPDIPKEEISGFLKRKKFSASEFYKIEILFIEKNIDSIFHISQYENFDLKEIKIPKNSIYALTAGFKTELAMKKLEENFVLEKNEVELLFKTISSLESDEIGGKFRLWYSPSFKDTFIDFKKLKIENSNKTPFASTELHSVVADAIVGRLLAGNQLTITNSANNFTVDASGATLSNAVFTLQDNSNKVRINISPIGSTFSNLQLDPGITILGNSGGTWSKRFWVDSSGNVNLTGTITATSGSLGGIGIASLIPGFSDRGGIYKTSDPVNYYIGSNGDLKWGALQIVGGSATFSGTIQADKLLGTISYSQIQDFPAEKIISGTTMSGVAVRGGTVYPGSFGLSSGLVDIYQSGSNVNIDASGSSSLRLLGSGSSNIFIGGSSVTVNGSLFATGDTYLQGNNVYVSGLMWITYGLRSPAGNGITTTLTVSTPSGNRTLRFSAGICYSTV